MKSIKQFIKDNHWSMIFAFALPLIIMAILYATMGIYPGSDRSILASDAFSQFSNFHASFHNVLTGKQNLFYTFNAGIGLNYYALISYYLGGLFTPLVFFFDNSLMPDALYFLTLLKIATAGLMFWFYAHETFKKLRPSMHIALSVAYSLMSFTLAQSEIVMWLDTFVYLPLVILGINRLMEKRKPKLLFVSYLLLFLTNYYFGFMIGIFSVMYFFVRYFTQVKTMKKTILPYFTTSILAGLSSMIMILPMYLDLKNNGETLTQITKFKTAATGAFDLIIKNMVGVYDTTRYDSIPFIYIGLLPLIFAIFYFVCRNINWKEKLGFFIIGTFLVASFYIEPLNLAWHGFHSPNMFLFRYSFLFSFFVIMLAGYAMEQLNEKNVMSVITIAALWLVATTAVYFLKGDGDYTYVKTINFYLTVAFLVIYLLCFVLFKTKHLNYKWLAVLCSLTMMTEAAINGHFMLKGILDDWNYASRSLYEEPRDEISSLVKASQENSTETKYRMENLDPISTNDSINFGYSGISFFSSIRNRNASEIMNQLGFRARGTALNARYDNNTLLMDSLFGIRYNIGKTPVNKYGFAQVESSNGYHLFENHYALPLGVKTDNAFNKFKWLETDNLGCQTNLVNALSGQNNQYFTMTYPKIVKKENSKVTEKDGVTTFEAIDSNKEQSIIYEVSLPKDSQSYYSIFPTNFGESGSLYATVSMMGGGRRSQVNLTGQYYNLGIFEKPTSLKFRVTFDNQSKVSLITPPIISLNLASYKKAMTALQKQGVNFKVDGRHVTAKVEMQKKQTTIFTTIPYDKGWSLTIDGKKQKISSFRGGFITFNVPQGKHKIELSFLPQGFIVGSILFVTCILLFIVFDYYYEYRRHSRHQK